MLSTSGLEPTGMTDGQTSWLLLLLLPSILCCTVLFYAVLCCATFPAID